MSHHVTVCRILGVPRYCPEKRDPDADLETVMGTWVPEGMTLWLPFKSWSAFGMKMAVSLRPCCDHDGWIFDEDDYEKLMFKSTMEPIPLSARVRWEEMDGFWASVLMNDGSSFSQQDGNLDHEQSYRKFEVDWHRPERNADAEKEVIGCGRQLPFKMGD
jgi:hypothetical protein